MKGKNGPRKATVVAFPVQALAQFSDSSFCFYAVSARRRDLSTLLPLHTMGPIFS